MLYPLSYEGTRRNRSTGASEGRGDASGSRHTTRRAFRACVRSRPEGADRQCKQTIGESERARSRVKDEAGEKALVELVPQPAEMARTVGRGRRFRLDFEANDASVCRLQQHVHFMTPLLRPKMVRPEPHTADADLGPDLRHDEGVEEPSEQVTVAQNAINVNMQRGPRKSCVDHVSSCQDTVPPNTNMPRCCLPICHALGYQRGAPAMTA